MQSELFLDASYAIALGSPRDQHHTAAVALAGRIELENSRLITTRAVLLEIGNALAKRQHRSAAVVLLNAIEHDRAVEVVPLSGGAVSGGLGALQPAPRQGVGIDRLHLLLAYAFERYHRSSDGR